MIEEREHVIGPAFNATNSAYMPAAGSGARIPAPFGLGSISSDLLVLSVLELNLEVAP